jgi:predicted nucleic acid-binding protein
MNKTIILDTSAIISLNALDSNHDRAVQIVEALAQSGATLVIPADVFTETLNVAGKKLGREKQLEIAHKLGESGQFVIASTQNVLKSALEMLPQMAESVSFTDCIVMAAAKHWETRYIFGFDEVFSKQGYKLPID